MNSARLDKIKRITLLALMLALTILFCFVPVQIGVITLALMILPTIILALVSEFKTTLFMGAMMGVVNLIAWYTTKAASPIAPIFQNPIVCIVPRIMVGVCAYLVRIWLEKLIFTNRIQRKYKDEYVRETSSDTYQSTSEDANDVDVATLKADSLEAMIFEDEDEKETSIPQSCQNSKKSKITDVALHQIIYIVSTAMGVVANTLFVAIFTLLFFNNTSIAENTVVTVEYVLAWFSLNFAIEVVAFSLIAPPIVLALKSAKLAK